MSTDELVSLDCPACRGNIHRPLNWFKQGGFTCPACGGRLTAFQFAAIVGELEQAFEKTVEEMLRGERRCDCNGCEKMAG